ncbi:MAG: hypothetical protein BMS9Abin05_0142 [Rhodothermia bacterium]|nr:MAG: hypothetical protein BMS9Abin05_0142 [Rhodothermia bacterium]
MNCCDPRDSHFGSKHAERDRARYEKQGPDRTTQVLLDSIRSQDLRNATLLDIGAGVGVIHHELLQDTCSHATHIDLSSAYIEAAEKESERRGHSERVEFIHGDLAEYDGTLESRDIVTLDRVVCCYPDFRSLLSRAVDKCDEVLAMSYPRYRWFVRLVMGLENLKRKIKGDPFRSFVHSPQEIRQIPESHGFRRRSIDRTPFWQIELYTR